MKKIKITYWTSTTLIGLMMAMSAFSSLTLPNAQEGFQHLGYPSYFRVELSIAKILGIIVLLAPFGKRIKEWAYMGFILVFISAFIAHAASGDPVTKLVFPVILSAILIVSYLSFHKMNGTLDNKLSPARQA